MQSINRFFDIFLCVDISNICHIEYNEYDYRCVKCKKQNMNYLDAKIRKTKVVPGQGYARDFKETGFDYSMAAGYVGIKPSKHFLVQFGHGKHFIGDGYRSLLLSDNAFNYPFLRIQTSFWKVQYTNLYAEMQDINYFENNMSDIEKKEIN